MNSYTLRVNIFLATFFVGACGATPDYIAAYQVHVFNETAHELNYDEIDFIITETVALNGGDTLRLRGLELSIVDEAFRPDDGTQVGGWVRVDAGYGEVAYSGTCFSSTAFGHELLHVLRGIHETDHSHSNRHVWGGLDGPWYVLGVEQAVKRRGGVRFCGYEDNIPTEPGTRLLRANPL